MNTGIQPLGKDSLGAGLEAAHLTTRKEQPQGQASPFQGWIYSRIYSRKVGLGSVCSLDVRSCTSAAAKSILPETKAGSPAALCWPESDAQ